MASTARSTCRSRATATALRRSALLEQRDQRLRTHGLHEMLVDAGGARALAVLLLTPAREHDDADARTAWLLPDELRGGQAIHARHAEIEKDHVRRIARRQRHRPRTAVGGL